MRGFKRFLSVLLALALISSSGLAPVGVAAAEHNCKTDDLTLGLAITGSAEVKDMVFDTTSSEELDDTDGDGNDLLGCDLFHGSTDVDKQEAVDKYSTMVEISSAAATGAQFAENKATAWENGLQGLETVARTDALAAYGRALQNDSTKQEAIQQANQSVDDFYAVRKANLVADWNTYQLTWRDYANQSLNEGIGGYAGPLTNAEGYAPSPFPYNTVNWDWGTVSLGNGTSKEYAMPEYYKADDYYWVVDLLNDAADSKSMGAGYTNSSTTNVSGPPLSAYQDTWEELNQQPASVKAEVKTWIDNTYQEVKDGNISWAEAVGSNTISRHFANQSNFQAWAFTRLSNMDRVSPPENLSRVGFYTVTHDNQTVQGLLASDSNPPSGAFERGETYNGSALDGPQYMILNSSIMELDGPFTIQNITNSQGETINKTVVKEVTYETYNTTNLQRILETNRELRAELETREERLRNQTAGGSGGGLLEDMNSWIPGLNGTQTAVLILVVAAAAIAYAGREESNVSIPRRRN